MLYAITMLLSKKHYPIVGQDGFREHYSSRSISWAADLWLKVLIWCKTILNISIHQIIPAFPLLYNWSVVIHFSLYCVGVNLQTYDWQLQPTEANGICLYLANPNYLRKSPMFYLAVCYPGALLQTHLQILPGNQMDLYSSQWTQCNWKEKCTVKTQIFQEILTVG